MATTETTKRQAIARFNAAVTEIAGPRPTAERRRAAVRLAIRQDPAAFGEYLTATNPHTVPRLLAEKADAVRAFYAARADRA